MKKVLFLAVIASLSSSAFAGNNIGCGLGSESMGEQDSVVMQVLAVTTNGTSGNQTFGITSGTLGCKKPSKIVSTELHQFVASNMDSLAQDIAQGQGEALDTLAQLMAVSSADRTAFNSKLQSNFGKIYTTASVDSAQVIDNIASVL